MKTNKNSFLKFIFEQSTWTGLATIIATVATIFGIPAHTFVGGIATAVHTGEASALIAGVAQLIPNSWLGQ